MLHDKWRKFEENEDEECKNFHAEIGFVVCDALARIEKVGEKCNERSAEIHSRIEAQRSQVSIDQCKLDAMLTNTLPYAFWFLFTCLLLFLSDEADLRDVSRQTGKKEYKLIYILSYN